MKCPNCQNEMVTEKFKEIDTEVCKNCNGKWFSPSELDTFEDSVFELDEFKNTLITNVRESDRSCPVCSKSLKKFNYRW